MSLQRPEPIETDAHRALLNRVKLDHLFLNTGQCDGEAPPETG